LYWGDKWYWNFKLQQGYSERTGKIHDLEGKEQHLTEHIATTISILRGGFSTANGKAIKISDEAFQKAKEIFSEIENVEHIGSTVVLSTWNNTSSSARISLPDVSTRVGLIYLNHDLNQFNKIRVILRQEREIECKIKVSNFFQQRFFFSFGLSF
jgi:hypothetical protein